ncbi:hypothetical protein LJR235_001403 [Pararhizobium sp. LjRoot235]|uniref:hypothetical protein n=1 Tax=Pararhizobium sp. LjRoot235 TaxID=3342291 RepID=UPI003ECE7915
MTISIWPDAESRFMTISIDGTLIDVDNPSQDIEFEVPASDGALIATGCVSARLLTPSPAPNVDPVAHESCSARTIR